ncbi:MAG: GntR family transcriptional regulator [Hungatella sp.]|jgi:GntR family transcriptional regulator|nr:GntR family transcriptional regulator [Hungatella sp.]
MSLYTKIADSILEKIKSGEWVPGHMMPSEKELCAQFKVSRPTVRAALSTLVNQGYVVRVKGKGSFVSRPKVMEDTTIFIESFSKEMRARGMEIKTEVLEQRVIPSDEDVAEHLGLHPGDEVFKLSRLRYVKDSFDKGPIVYNITYIPTQYIFLQKEDFEQESLTSIFKRNHLQRRHLKKNISAVLITSRLARILGVEDGSLGILIHSVSFLEDREQVVEYTLSYYPSDRNTFILHMSV